jgi:hypothetical protein
MKNSYVKELVKRRNSLKTKKTVFEVATVACLAAGVFTAGTVTAVCGATVIIGLADTQVSLNKVEEEIRDQGCTCVL